MSVILTTLLHMAGYLAISWILLIIISNTYSWFTSSLPVLEGMSLCGNLYWICLANPVLLIFLCLPGEWTKGIFMYSFFWFLHILSSPITGWKDLWAELKEMCELKTETHCEKGIIMTRQGRNGNFGEWQEVCLSTDVKRLEEYLENIKVGRGNDK